MQNHSLNMECMHAASTAIDSITFFGTIKNWFLFFYTPRWDVLLSVSRRGVKRSVETCWIARSKAITNVKHIFKTFYVFWKN